jgi:hypothetical protein
MTRVPLEFNFISLDESVKKKGSGIPTLKVLNDEEESGDDWGIFEPRSSGSRAMSLNCSTLSET